MNKIIEALRKNKQLLLYLFFGICTTAINTICYWLLYDVLLSSNITSTVLAWLAAVVFAFVCELCKKVTLNAITASKTS